MENFVSARGIVASVGTVLNRRGNCTTPVILCGHTHIQRSVSLPTGQTVVNPGSVGLPAYEDDSPTYHKMESGSPHARYAIVSRLYDVELATDVNKTTLSNHSIARQQAQSKQHDLTRENQVAISVLQLWLPIVVGTGLAWIASGLIHMLLKYHHSDYQQLTNEDEVMSAVQKGSPKLGIHAFPYCSDMAGMGDPDVQQKFARGPVGMLTVFPNGTPKMGKLMAQQISFFLLGCTLIAYSTTLAMGPGAEYLVVFRFVAVIGFLTFGWAVIPFSIWYGHQWSTTAKYLLDALIYGLVVAGSFAWLWPVSPL